MPQRCPHVLTPWQGAHGWLTDAFPEQAVVSPGMCHQCPAVTAGCAAAGRHKHAGWIGNELRQRCCGVGWVPASLQDPSPLSELQCLSLAQEDIKFDGCPEIIISGKHSLIFVCLAGFYCLPFLRAPLCPDPFSQFMSSPFHPSFASHPFWLFAAAVHPGKPFAESVIQSPLSAH